MSLKKNLQEYILDPYNGLKNFNLGTSYDDIKQSASAYSYYIRSSEHSDDIDLIYESLLKAAYCLRTVGKRDYSEKGLYYHAISQQPNRPEAYFALSQYYERHKQWQSSYTMACIGLSNVNNNKNTRTKIDYHGEYGFIFNKAVSSWWIGLNQQSRKLFNELITKYDDVMDDLYKNLTHQNIKSIGVGPNLFIHKMNNVEENTKNA
jgi:tetratricopeptide (TPR) repeat protein